MCRDRRRGLEEGWRGILESDRCDREREKKRNRVWDLLEAFCRARWEIEGDLEKGDGGAEEVSGAGCCVWCVEWGRRIWVKLGSGG